MIATLAAERRMDRLDAAARMIKGPVIDGPPFPLGAHVAVAAGDTIFHGMTGEVVALDSPAPPIALRKVKLDGVSRAVWFGCSELVAA